MDSNTPMARVVERKTSKSKFTLVTRPPAVVKRVIYASPNGGNCIVEHRACADSDARLGLQLCHCFGRANSLDGDLMSAIEYHWGMERGSLNIDSRWNCFYAGSNFHSMFDDGMWCLLPKMEILQRYMDAIGNDVRRHGSHVMQAMQEDDLQPVGDGHKLRTYHTYTLLPFHPEMKKTAIHRYNVEEPGFEESDITRYVFPFNKPEPLEVQSHIHPKFVILSLGQHLAHTSRIPQVYRQAPHIMEYEKEINLLEKIYEMWVEELEPKDLTDPDFRPHSSFRGVHHLKSSTDRKSYKGKSIKPNAPEKEATEPRRSSRIAGKKVPHVEGSGALGTASRATQVIQPVGSSGGRIPVVLDRSEGENEDEGEVYDGSDDEGDVQGDGSGLKKRRAESPPMGPPAGDPSTPSQRHVPSVKKPRTES